jgi:hypothetical protein
MSQYQKQFYNIYNYKQTTQAIVNNSLINKLNNAFLFVIIPHTKILGLYINDNLVYVTRLGKPFTDFTNYIISLNI